jgi:hypothetical protein
MPLAFAIGPTACAAELVGPTTTQPTKGNKGRDGGEGGDGGGEGDKRGRH